MPVGDSRRLAVGRECLSNVPPTGLGSVQKIERLSIVGARSEDRVQAVWYIIGFAIAAGGFAFLTFGAAWLISHRNRGDIHNYYYQIDQVRAIADYDRVIAQGPAAYRNTSVCGHRLVALNGSMTPGLWLSVVLSGHPAEAGCESNSPGY